MDYRTKLVFRVIIALTMALIPIDVFYITLLKPTLYASTIFLSGYSPMILGDAIVINDVIFRFVPACVATLAYLLLLLIILLTKDLEFKRGIKMFIVGSIIIFIANIIRIDLLIYAYFEYGSNLFEKLHLVIWKAISGIFVAFVWIILSHVYGVKEIPVISDINELYKRSMAKNN